MDGRLGGGARSQDAGDGILGPSVPTRLQTRINPDVLAERRRRIAARLRDIVGDRVRRRRCAEIVAAHLLDSTSDDPPHAVAA
jgi:hypothetical protein